MFSEIEATEFCIGGLLGGGAKWEDWSGSEVEGFEAWV